MSNYFNSIIGNSHITERLSRDVKDRCVSHALIFEGAQGSGRHTIARTLAAAIECHGGIDTVPCGKCISCQKIFEDKSPDVITVGIEGDKATLGVDAIRFLKNDISIAPNDLSVKIYIVEDADKMTLQAQNALLLSLEEPPPYVIFILICENSSTLLETIKSRAPILRTDKLSDEMVSEYLLKNEKKTKSLFDESSEEFSELVCAAAGSIGKAISLLDGRERKRVFSDRQIARDFMSLALDRSRVKTFEMISSLGNKRPEIISRLIQIQHAIRDLTMLKKSDTTDLCFYSDMEYATELSSRFTLKRLLLMNTAIDSAIDSLSRNSNVRLTLLSMLCDAELL